MPEIETALLFDMRAPEFGTPTNSLYPEALAMAEFADTIGVSRIGVMEHHGSEDGYLPAPFVLGGGIAARTRRARITLGAVILPLHDPVKIAEQAAVLDLMSGGRLEIILGAGYVPSEFALFEVPLTDRAKLLDRGLDIIIRALRGERFEAGGRPIHVRPLPIQTPNDILLGGGGVEASARRAARFGIGFAPLRNELIPLYEAESRKHGREPGRIHPQSAQLNIHLATDPDATWPKVWRHFAHVAASYAKWAAAAGSPTPFSGMDNETALRESGIFAVWTPEQLLERLPAVAPSSYTLNFMPLIGGLAPELGWESLTLLRDRVIPKLR